MKFNITSKVDNVTQVIEVTVGPAHAVIRYPAIMNKKVVSRIEKAENALTRLREAIEQ